VERSNDHLFRDNSQFGVVSFKVDRSLFKNVLMHRFVRLGSFIINDFFVTNALITPSNVYLASIEFE
jgi:hypothetical protein